MFEYPQTSYGTVYTTLCALTGSGLHESDLHSMVFKVGLWKTAETRNSEVINFLESENISYSIVYYSTADDQRAALADGEVDMISGLSLSPVDNTRIIAKFAARPYFLPRPKAIPSLLNSLTLR